MWFTQNLQWPECHWAKMVPSRSHASRVNVPLDFLPPGFLSCCSVSVPFLFFSYMIFPWSQVLWRICLVNATLIIYSSLAGRPQSSVMRSILFTASSYYYILIFFLLLSLRFVVWYNIISLFTLICTRYVCVYIHTLTHTHSIVTSHIKHAWRKSDENIIKVEMTGMIVLK